MNQKFDFDGLDKPADWTPHADAVTSAGNNRAYVAPQKVNWLWAVLTPVGIVAVLIGLWMRRRPLPDLPVASTRYSARQRVMDEGEPDDIVPDTMRKAVVPVASGNPADSTFQLYLGRAGLLVGKAARPDTGRC